MKTYFCIFFVSFLCVKNSFAQKKYLEKLNSDLFPLEEKLKDKSLIVYVWPKVTKLNEIKIVAIDSQKISFIALNRRKFVKKGVFVEHEMDFSSQDSIVQNLLKMRKDDLFRIYQICDGNISRRILYSNHENILKEARKEKELFFIKKIPSEGETSLPIYIKGSSYKVDCFKATNSFRKAIKKILLDIQIASSKE